MAEYMIPEGTSEPQDFALFNGANALNGSGLTVGLLIHYRPRGRSLQVYEGPQPTADWLNQPNGTVRVSGVEALPQGYYYVRFSLTDGSGSVGYAPNGNAPDVWKVVNP